MSWRRIPPPPEPMPDARTLVMLAVCRATEGEASAPVDVLEVIAGAGLVAGDTLALLALLDGEGLVMLDEEEQFAAVSLTDDGAAWAAAHHRAWAEYG